MVDELGLMTGDSIDNLFDVQDYLSDQTGTDCHWGLFAIASQQQRNPVRNADKTYSRFHF